jgi:hypothetical protein
MPELTDEDRNALEKAQALQRYRTLRDAFVALFGPPGAPTPHGDLVLKHLDKFCGRGSLNIVSDQTGATDIPKTFRNVGRREVADAIYDMIAWRESDADRN